MKKIFVILLFFIISLQSWTNADDISEFEIEGMSIGESLLDFFKENEIINHNIDKKKENRNFERIIVFSKNNPLKEKYAAISANLNTYDAMHIFIKREDKKYIIRGIEGMLNFEFNFSDCLKKKDEIEKSISELFINSKKETRNNHSHPNDETGKSKTYATFIEINPDSRFYELRLTCFDWSKEKGYIDHFRISILSDEVNQFVNNLYN
tara:strand:+ start:707 stop:1333 length:627 start_codon:yes stop_codon:yes gene_type:complete